MKLADFQKQAVDQLCQVFLDLWKTGNRRLPLVFKAPTGAGKTIMMAEFLRSIDSHFQFYADKAYLWISFGGDESYSQSKKKLYNYFNEGTDIGLKDISNFNEGKLYKNNVFFINWSKIKASNKEGRKLRKETETTDKGIFDDFIEHTKRERDIILIVDEAHREAGERLPLYEELIDLIDPRIIIKVTATPEKIPNASDTQNKRAGFVEVNENDVIESGLIKKQLIIQTEEEIAAVRNTKLTEDEKMLEMAFNKREELKKHYADQGCDINPLVLIQLPSDYKETQGIKDDKKGMALTYLKSKGVQDDKIAIWLSGEHQNLDNIEQNNNEVSFMIFKVAPATGWDCPRADILVMFREIQNPTFHTQILGRIKRMPEAKHYEESALNNAYIYTNYNKQHIRDVKESESPNKPPIYVARLKEHVRPIPMETAFISRIDYNTLEVPTKWQASCIKSFHEYFGTDAAKFAHQNREIVAKKIDLTKKNVENSIVANAQIDSFDNFADEIKAKGKDVSYTFSDYDITRLYDWLCFKELKEQEDARAQYNPSRSWGALKKALNVYFQDVLQVPDYYDVIVNELLKTPSESELKKAIYKALVDFRPIHDQIVEAKDEERLLRILVPNREISFTDDYEHLPEINRNAYDKFFFPKKDYDGKKNEYKFIAFLEKQPIEWWHKQKNSGQDSFGVKYYNSQEKKLSIFYPDFVIKTKTKLFIVDTKSGFTAKSQETADKAKGLQAWIAEHQQNYPEQIVGGIVMERYPNWLLNTAKQYVYEDDAQWHELHFDND